MRNRIKKFIINYVKKHSRKVLLHVWGVDEKGKLKTERITIIARSRIAEFLYRKFLMKKIPRVILVHPNCKALNLKLTIDK